MKIPPRLLGLALLALIMPHAARSDAACNAIPIAAKTYLSDKGTVSAPFAAPGQVVTITLGCSGSPPFAMAPADRYHVELQFGGPGSTGLHGPTVMVRIESHDMWVVDAMTLQFRVPETTSATVQYGRAGPAQIRVLDGSTTEMAKIWQLYQPADSGCPMTPDGVFKYFTVLPRPNEVQDLLKPTPKNPLLMTLDGDDDLLIPFDHTSVLPNTSNSQSQGVPVAIFEQGFGKFKAFKSGTTIAQALAVAPARDTLLRSFSADGRPLPPLLRLDDRGGLFGTADAAQSVLRVARTYMDANSTPHAVYDLVYQLTQNGTGPIVIKKAANFQMATCFPVPLTGLRSSEKAVAYARDESLHDERTDLNGDGDLLDRVVEIHDAAKASGGSAGGCTSANSSLTKRAVTELAAGGVSRPVVETTGSIVAFLEHVPASATDILRVYSATGQEYTAAKTAIAASTEPVVNHRVLAVSNPFPLATGPTPTTGPTPSPPLVFLRSAGAAPELRVFDPATKDFRANAQQPADRVAVAEGRAVLWTLRTSPQAAGLYDGGADAFTSLVLPAMDAALSGTRVALAASDSGRTVLAVGNTTLGSTPSKTGVGTDAVAVTGTTVVFSTPESVEPVTAPGCVATKGGGCDLNGDGDALDRVLRYRVDGGPITPVGYPPANGPAAAVPVEDFIVQGDLIAFRTSEKAQSKETSTKCGTKSPPGGCDRNDDGDADDFVMQIYKFDPGLGSGTLFNTGQAAIAADVPGFEWMNPYAIVGHSVFFLTREADQGHRDLDGDGNHDGTVLQIFDVDSLKTQTITLAITTSSKTAPAQITLLEHSRITLRVKSPCPDGDSDGHLAVVGDQDGDGTLDPFDNCVQAPNAWQVDDDFDGLGDGACDPCRCDPFTPAAPLAAATKAERASRRKMAKAALQYLDTRAGTTNDCATGVIEKKGLRDLRTYCDGYVAGGAEVLPQEPRTASRLAKAGADLLASLTSLTGSCGRTSCTVIGDAAQSACADRILDVQAESVIAASHVAYGDVLPTSESPAQCALGRGHASATYLGTLVGAMEDCLDQLPLAGEGGHTFDAATSCLGRLAAHELIPPSNPKTAAQFLTARKDLTKIIGPACAEESAKVVDACRTKTDAAEPAIPCTVWRRAVEAVRSIYGPDTVENARVTVRSALPAAE